MAKLQRVDDRLELHFASFDAPSPDRLVVDFTKGRMGYRGPRAGRRNEPLARAIGLKAGDCPHVIDTTAGLGSDAFILAQLGCTVTLCESHPLLAALLEDGLKRAAQHEALAPTIARMQLIPGDARDTLRTHQADVVYLDPMYPHRQKSAAAKKPMQLLQRLLGAHGQGEDLLELALGRASSSGVRPPNGVAPRFARVVVKRPLRAPPLGEIKPHHSIEGSSTRFDVYLGNYSK
ncbi:16S rRNA (guanine1516-N2)-methyltransferase [Ectothiorhodosinus mongolicus]|uniref:Ribosomal RNA small subunit methyltransferase J n=1 Tax=Ectothiorhodosinus mongolicus TaxID=233100 RepID=A0A1R3VS39_9GAMM|nr:16S rRNA (guanine1516-N2)-methyltransferase [Ectothiorhodosinus mongolicus]